MSSDFRLRRALPTRRTAIEDWPEDWLRYIEPKIVRSPVTEGDHWFWTGYMKSQYPTLTIKVPGGSQVIRTVSNLIVCLFWHVPEDLQERQWYVEIVCGYKNCINPHHFIPKTRFRGDPNA